VAKQCDQAASLSTWSWPIASNTERPHFRTRRERTESLKLFDSSVNRVTLPNFKKASFMKSYPAQLMENLNARKRAAGLTSAHTTVDIARLEIPESEQLDALARETVHTIQQGLPKSFPEIYVKLDWVPWRTWSRGGRYQGEWRSRLNDHEMTTGPGINLAMHRRLRNAAVGTVAEYKHLSKFGDVGDFHVDGPEDSVVLVVLHEVAHAIDHTSQAQKAASISLFGNRLVLPQRSEPKPHGIRFIRIYSALRTEFDRVDNSRTLTSDLADELLDRVERWSRVPDDVDEWAKDPLRYTRERRRRKQKTRREQTRGDAL